MPGRGFVGIRELPGFSRQTSQLSLAAARIASRRLMGHIVARAISMPVMKGWPGRCRNPCPASPAMRTCVIVLRGGTVPGRGFEDIGLRSREVEMMLDAFSQAGFSPTETSGNFRKRGDTKRDGLMGDPRTNLGNVAMTTGGD